MCRRGAITNVNSIGHQKGRWNKCSLPYKFFQRGILNTIRTSLVLAFIHRAIHARFEERASRRVRIRRHKFEKLIDVTVQVAPHKIGSSICFARAELEFLTYQKHLFFVS